MAKKVRRIQFSATWFDSGLPKYEAGKNYPVTEETKRLAGQGIAQEVLVDAEPELEVAPTDADFEAAIKSAAAEIAAGRMEPDYPVNQMANHFKVEAATVKEKLEAAIAEAKGTPKA